MAMSVSPGRSSSLGFCHIRRQGNRSLQKQIICPIYRGRPASRPYRMGPEPVFSVGTGGPNDLEGLRSQSLLQSGQISPSGQRRKGVLNPRPGSIWKHFARKRRLNASVRGLFGGDREPSLRIHRRHHEVVDARHDFRAKAGTVEHAVVSDALLHVVNAAMTRN